MSPREYCAYNETRANLVAPRVSLIDTRSDPLKAVKVLIEGLAPNADAGLWLNPLKSIPAVPRLSAYDLVYLDHQGCVVHGIELAPDDEVPPIDGLAASALLLPLHSFTASQAQPGDRVVLQLPNETCAPPAPDIAPARSKPAEAQHPAPAILAKLPSLAWSPREPVEAQPPAAARRRFSLLHMLTHLRIHIQISIAFAPAPVSAVSTPQSALVAAQPPAPVLRAATQTAAPSAPPQLHPELHAENPQAWCPVDDVVGDGVAKLGRTRDRRFNSFLGRRWRSSRAAYLRWADSFVFDRPQAQPDYGLPRLGRNLFHFIFPR